jgi:hypothetical protein
MSTYFFAYIEVLRDANWQLSTPLQQDPDTAHLHLIPQNIAPPWGWDDIQAYCELSGEKGIPVDLSNALQTYIQTEWAGGQDAFQATWLTLAEIKEHLVQDTADRYPHFNPDWFADTMAAYQMTNETEIRVIFWHD